MKTPIQELIDKYSDHLKYDDDLDTISGREILKIVLVDLISYQVKEKDMVDSLYTEEDLHTILKLRREWYSHTDKNVVRDFIKTKSK